jgi:peptide/nickel transport system ATP-binding protein
VTTLLEVDDLRVRAGDTVLLDGVGFGLAAGDTLGIAGESGCGKSVLALAVMGLLPPGLRASGRVSLNGENLLGLPDRLLCRLRGRVLAMVFQEPMLALNPVRSIGAQVAESMRWQLGLSRAAAETKTRRLLDRVGLPPARVSVAAYPHQISGGQRQRVMIAIALACDPAVLIADEFSTALDTTTQAQVTDLLAELAAETGMALLLISHDLGLVARIARRVLVLYAGRVAETGPTGAVFGERRHPYTRGLVAATLHGRDILPGTPLPCIPGQVPDPARRPAGCAFVPRCDRARPDCATDMPLLTGPGAHKAACLHQILPA